MRTNGYKGMLPALAAGLLLLAGAGAAAAAQDKQEEQQQEPSSQQEQAKTFSFRFDPLVIGAMDTDVDTRSSKFQEYRDLSSGYFMDFGLVGGGSGDRYLDLDATQLRRDDARYTLEYGVLGRYEVLFDYNKIPHRFGNGGRMLFTRT